MTITKAIVLAAGMGSRLGALTINRPKALISINGTPLLHRLIEQLAAVGITEMTIVVGYLAEQITALGHSHAGIKLRYVHAVDYRTTNNIVSLACCGDLEEPTMLADCDVVLSSFPDRWLESDASADIVVPVRTSQFGERGTHIVQSTEGSHNIVVRRQEDTTERKALKSLSLYFLHSSKLLEALNFKIRAAIRARKTQLYYEDILGELSFDFKVAVLDQRDDDVTSFEVDNVRDLTMAKRRFASSERSTNFAQGV